MEQTRSDLRLGGCVVPASHADLLDRALSVVMTTEMSDGRLQSTMVWFGHDGEDVLVNTMREFRKARNLRARPRTTLLLTEPPSRRAPSGGSRSAAT